MSPEPSEKFQLTNEGDNNGSASQEQTLNLIFQVAWGSSGSTKTRILTFLITTSVVLRITANGVMVFALLVRKAMRTSKQHLLVAYMSLYDFADGCWYFCMTGLDYGIHSRWSCFLTLRHAFWFLFGGQGSAMMLTVISMDRLLAVWKPVWYRQQGPEISHKWATATLLWTLCFGAYLVHIPFTRPDDLVPFCFTSHTFMEGFSIDGAMRQVWLGLSVAIYLVVVVVYRMYIGKRITRIEEAGASQRQLDMETKKLITSQNRVTVSLGISSTITLIFNVVPLFIWHWLRREHPSLQQLGYVLFAFINLSSAVNIILFYRRHDEIRKAILSLLMLRSMPSNLNEWDSLTPSSFMRNVAASKRVTTLPIREN